MPVITLHLNGRRPSSIYLLYDKAGSRFTFSTSKKGKHHAAKYKRKQDKKGTRDTSVNLMLIFNDLSRGLKHMNQNLFIL